MNKVQMVDNVDRIYKLAIVAPTSFFYQAPIYRELAANPRIDLKVYFCSKESVSGQDVRIKFRTDSRWEDSDRTLIGYDYTFIRNYAPRPSYLRWPFGLMNFGIFKEVQSEKPDAIVIMSWVNITDLISITASLIFNSKLFIMTDANFQAEIDKSKVIRWFKKMFLGRFIFGLADGFLYTGTANKLLYQSYGIKEDKLVPFAFSWESKGFLEMSKRFGSLREEIREQFDIPLNDFVILYCGRLSEEKAPMDLLQAYRLVESQDANLIIVGDGHLREQMQSYVLEHGMHKVRFLGFRSREEIGKFYAASDVLVLPSRQEATGAVVTEGMCFGLPIITSDRVGFSIDLVDHGVNGYIFPVGDTEALSFYLDTMINTDPAELRKMSQASIAKMKDWVSLDLADSLIQHLDNIYGEKRD